MYVCVFATSESFGRVLLLLPLDFSAEPPHTQMTWLHSEHQQ